MKSKLIQIFGEKHGSSINSMLVTIFFMALSVGTTFLIEYLGNLQSQYTGEFAALIYGGLRILKFLSVFISKKEVEAEQTLGEDIKNEIIEDKTV